MELSHYRTLVDNIDAGNTHRLIATRQSTAYQRDKIELAADAILIEIDWKQKVIIGKILLSCLEHIFSRFNISKIKFLLYRYFSLKGMSPRQVSREFREQQQRTLIGFGIFYINHFGELDCLNIDLVSNNQGQSGFDTVHSFRFNIFVYFEKLYNI